jgi:serine/threonine-protein kinase
MFLDEARLAARIHHPNVVSTLDVEHGPDGLFIVMEYIDGGSADDLVSGAVAARTPLPTGVAVRVVLDMLAGLQAAHELTDAEGSPLNLVHRDVSPPNLLIGFDGVARLSDFGVAHTERRLAGSTQPGALKGKLGYMSPEQIGDLPVDRRSDIYAAGVVAWELLTGSWLFGDEWGRGILLHALKGPREAPHAVNGAVPVGVSEACMRALARDAIDRYASAAEFADAIERACAEANVSIANPTQVAETMRAVMAAGRAARGESASAR